LRSTPRSSTPSGPATGTRARDLVRTNKYNFFFQAFFYDALGSPTDGGPVDDRHLPSQDDNAR
jgi:hypothetical protein